MDLRPANDNENPPLQRTTASRAEPRVSTSGTRCRHAVIFNGVPMDLQPTNDNENPSITTHDR